MIEFLLECDPGTRTTTARLYARLFGDFDYSDNLIDDKLLEIDSRLLWEARQHGLLLDFSEFNNMTIGLPFNILFTVYKQDNAKTNLDCLKLVTFKINGFNAANEQLFIKINHEKEAIVDYYKYHFSGDKERTFNVNQELLVELSSVMKSVDACAWSNYYYNCYLDGFEWDMAICDSSYNCILVEGSNGVPEGFDKVFGVLKKIGLEWEGPFEPDYVAQGGITDNLCNCF